VAAPGAGSKHFERDRLQGYLPTLDGWRAIAVLLVVFGHCAGSPTTYRWEAALANRTPTIGPFGVQIFFAISGLLITSRLMEEWARRGQISLKEFYIRRSFRILPALVAYLLIVAAAGAMKWLPLTATEWIQSILFVRNYGGAGNWATGHTWSLAVEEHFYLLWPMVIVFAGRGRSMWIAIGAATLVATWRVTAVHFSLVHSVLADHHSDEQMDTLLGGAVFALLMANPAFYRKAKARLTPAVTYGLIFSFLLGVACLIRWWSGFHNPIRLTLPVFLPLLLISTVLHPRLRFCRLLELASMRWLGRLSYSLYLWQEFFSGPGVPAPRWLWTLRTYPVDIVASLVMAVLSYYALERPMIAIGHRLAKPVSAGRGDMRS